MTLAPLSRGSPRSTTLHLWPSRTGTSPYSHAAWYSPSSPPVPGVSDAMLEKAYWSVWGQSIKTEYCLNLHRRLGFFERPAGHQRRPLCAVTNDLLHLSRMSRERRAPFPDRREPLDDDVGHQLLAINAADRGGP